MTETQGDDFDFKLFPLVKKTPLGKFDSQKVMKRGVVTISTVKHLASLVEEKQKSKLKKQLSLKFSSCPTGILKLELIKCTNLIWPGMLDNPSPICFCETKKSLNISSRCYQTLSPIWRDIHYLQINGMDDYINLSIRDTDLIKYNNPNIDTEGWEVLANNTLKISNFIDSSWLEFSSKKILLYSCENIKKIHKEKGSYFTEESDSPLKNYNPSFQNELMVKYEYYSSSFTENPEGTLEFFITKQSDFQTPLIRCETRKSIALKEPGDLIKLQTTNILDILRIEVYVKDLRNIYQSVFLHKVNIHAIPFDKSSKYEFKAKLFDSVKNDIIGILNFEVTYKKTEKVAPKKKVLHSASTLLPSKQAGSAKTGIYYLKINQLNEGSWDSLSSSSQMYFRFHFSQQTFLTKSYKINESSIYMNEQFAFYLQDQGEKNTNSQKIKIYGYLNDETQTNTLIGHSTLDLNLISLFPNKKLIIHADISSNSERPQEIQNNKLSSILELELFFVNNLFAKNQSLMIGVSDLEVLNLDQADQDLGFSNYSIKMGMNNIKSRTGSGKISKTIERKHIFKAKFTDEISKYQTKTGKYFTSADIPNLKFDEGSTFLMTGPTDMLEITLQKQKIGKESEKYYKIGKGGIRMSDIAFLWPKSPTKCSINLAYVLDQIPQHSQKSFDSPQRLPHGKQTFVFPKDQRKSDLTDVFSAHQIILILSLKFTHPHMIHFNSTKFHLFKNLSIEKNEWERIIDHENEKSKYNMEIIEIGVNNLGRIMRGIDGSHNLSTVLKVETESPSSSNPALVKRNTLSIKFESKLERQGGGYYERSKFGGKKNEEVSKLKEHVEETKAMRIFKKGLKFNAQKAVEINPKRSKTKGVTLTQSHLNLNCFNRLFLWTNSQTPQIYLQMELHKITQSISNLFQLYDNQNIHPEPPSLINLSLLIKHIQSQHTNRCAQNFANRKEIIDSDIDFQIQKYTSKFIDNPDGIFTMCIRKFKIYPQDLKTSLVVIFERKSESGEKQKMIKNELNAKLKDVHELDLRSIESVPKIIGERKEIDINECLSIPTSNPMDKLLISIKRAPEKGSSQERKMGLIASVSVPFYQLPLQEDDFDATVCLIGNCVYSSLAKETPIFEIDFTANYTNSTCFKETEDALVMHQFRILSKNNFKNVQDEVLSKLLEERKRHEIKTPLSKLIRLVRKVQKLTPLRYFSNCRDFVRLKVDERSFFFKSLAGENFQKMQALISSILNNWRNQTTSTGDEGLSFNFGNREFMHSGYNKNILQISLPQGISLTSSSSYTPKSKFLLRFMLDGTILSELSTSLKDKSHKTTNRSNLLSPNSQLFSPSQNYNNLLLFKDQKIYLQNVKPNSHLEVGLFSLNENFESKEIGSFSVLCSELDLIGWRPKNRLFIIKSNPIQIHLRFIILFSDFINNPRKKIGVQLHRLVHIPPECVSNFKLARNSDKKPLVVGKGEKSERNNVLILLEQVPLVKSLSVAEKTLLKNQSDDNLVDQQKKMDLISSLSSLSSLKEEAPQRIDLMLNLNLMKQEGNSITMDEDDNYKIKIDNDGYFLKKELHEYEFYVQNIQDYLNLQLQFDYGTNHLIHHSDSFSDKSNKSNETTIVQCNLKFADFPLRKDKACNLFLPLNQMESSMNTNLKKIWLNNCYKFNDIYLLASVFLQSTVYGVLKITIDRFKNVIDSHLLKPKSDRVEKEIIGSHKRKLFYVATIKTLEKGKNSEEKKSQFSKKPNVKKEYVFDGSPEFSIEIDEVYFDDNKEIRFEKLGLILLLQLFEYSSSEKEAVKIGEKSFPIIPLIKQIEQDELFLQQRTLPRNTTEDLLRQDTELLLKSGDDNSSYSPYLKTILKNTFVKYNENKGHSRTTTPQSQFFEKRKFDRFKTGKSMKSGSFLLSETEDGKFEDINEINKGIFQKEKEGFKWVVLTNNLNIGYEKVRDTILAKATTDQTAFAKKATAEGLIKFEWLGGRTKVSEDVRSPSSFSNSRKHEYGSEPASHDGTMKGRIGTLGSLETLKPKGRTTNMTPGTAIPPSLSHTDGTEYMEYLSSQIANNLIQLKTANTHSEIQNALTLIIKNINSSLQFTNTHHIQNTNSHFEFYDIDILIPLLKHLITICLDNYHNLVLCLKLFLLTIPPPLPTNAFTINYQQKRLTLQVYRKLIFKNSILSVLFQVIQTVFQDKTTFQSALSDQIYFLALKSFTELSFQWEQSFDFIYSNLEIVISVARKDNVDEDLIKTVLLFTKSVFSILPGGKDHELSKIKAVYRVLQNYLILITTGTQATILLMDRYAQQIIIQRIISLITQFHLHPSLSYLVDKETSINVLVLLLKCFVRYLKRNINKDLIDVYLSHLNILREKCIQQKLITSPIFNPQISDSEEEFKTNGIELFQEILFDISNQILDYSFKLNKILSFFFPDSYLEIFLRKKKEFVYEIKETLLSISEAKNYQDDYIIFLFSLLEEIVKADEKITQFKSTLPTANLFGLTTSHTVLKSRKRKQKVHRVQNKKVLSLAYLDWYQ